MTAQAFSPHFVRGRSSYRNVGSSDVLTRTASVPASTLFTACGWAVHRVIDGSHYDFIFTIEDSLTNAANTIGWGTQQGSTLAQYYTGNTGFIAVGGGGGKQYVANVPFFWALVSSSVSSVIGYIRFINEYSWTTGSSAGISHTPAAFHLGRDSYSGEHFEGNLWNVKVWDAALTAEELMRESLSHTPVRLKDLNSWYPLEGNMNEILLDRSGRGLHLTQSGTGYADKFFLPASLLGRYRREGTGQTSGAAAYTLTITQGSYSLTGQSVNLVANRSLSLTQGSYALTGQNVNLQLARNIVAAQGSYSLNGQSVRVVADRSLSLTAGSYSINGQSVILSVTADKVLVATAGSYALTGQSTGLSATRGLSVTQGAYALTGQTTGLAVSRSLSLTAGSYVLSGQGVTLALARGLVLTSGAYNINGINVNLLWSGAPVTTAADSVVWYRRKGRR